MVTEESKSDNKPLRIQVNDIATGQLFEMIIHGLKSLDMRLTELEHRFNMVDEEIIKELSTVANSQDDDDEEEEGGETGPPARLAPYA